MPDLSPSPSSAAAPSTIGVEVVYAFPHEQIVIDLRLPPAATVRAAIEASAITTRFPEIAIERNGVGLFGRRCGLDEPLSDGDRVELYRPLTIDAKENRRRRVAQARARKGTRRG
jgi:putative ubiquitin-RnfH superfamily antitoxin RatB of RatAB toxin-antitoxin module